MNTPDIAVSDAAFEYLRLQKGSLDRFATQRKLWEKAYRDDLAATFNECRPYLPSSCWGLLDIGSGLGGIDVLLARHYDVQPFVCLLDGKNDAPVMTLHRQTFSNERVARDFLRANGIRSERIRYFGPDAQDLAAPYDLVVSFGSWCFHYEPDQYLPRLIGGGGLHADSVVILDVRNDKPEYWAQLQAHFVMVGRLREARKYTRAVFKRWTK